jgi:O-antigen ligase
VTARVEASSWAVAAALAALSVLLGLLAGIDPALAIGASLGFAFLLLAFADLTAGLVAFALLSFLEFVLPGGPALSLIKGAGLLLALSWIARIATSRGRPSFFSAHPGATLLLLAFLGWGAVSIAWSDSPSSTLVDLSRYLQVIALVVITYTAIESRSQAGWLIAAFLAGTAVTAVWGLVSTPSSDPAVQFRVASTVGNANVLATVLVSGLALALGAAAALRRSTPLRAGALGVAGLCLLTLVFTGSRSGVVSVVVVLIVAILVAGRWRAQVLVASLSVALAAVVLFAALAPSDIKQRIAATTPGQLPDTEGRLTLWAVAWRMVEDQPLRGVGLGSFQTSSVHYVLQPGPLTRSDQVIDTPKVTHNIYLQALAETGVVGLVLFIAVLGFPIACALRAARNFERLGDSEMEIMARALVAALAGVLAADFFASEQFSKLLWLLLGLGPALLAISLSGAPTRGARLRQPSRPRPATARSYSSS